MVERAGLGDWWASHVMKSVPPQKKKKKKQWKEGPITIKPQPDLIVEDEHEWQRQGKKSSQWHKFFYDLTFDVNILCGF